MEIAMGLQTSKPKLTHPQLEHFEKEFEKRCIEMKINFEIFSQESKLRLLKKIEDDFFQEEKHFDEMVTFHITNFLNEIKKL